VLSFFAASWFVSAMARKGAREGAFPSCSFFA